MPGEFVRIIHPSAVIGCQSEAPRHFHDVPVNSLPYPYVSSAIRRLKYCPTKWRPYAILPCEMHRRRQSFSNLTLSTRSLCRSSHLLRVSMDIKVPLLSLVSSENIEYCIEGLKVTGWKLQLARGLTKGVNVQLEESLAENFTLRFIVRNPFKYVKIGITFEALIPS